MLHANGGIPPRTGSDDRLPLYHPPIHRLLVEAEAAAVSPLTRRRPS